MSITLSPDQDAAVRGVVEWYRAGAPHGIAKLIGPAGSGKTTVASAILDALGIRDETILNAPTGRAAYRLHQTTGLEAISCHRLVRSPTNEVDQRGGPVFSRRVWANGRVKMILVDEAGMVGFDLSKSLLSFTQPKVAVMDRSSTAMIGQWDDPELPCVPVLAMGDPFQLPPISDKPEPCLLECRKSGPTFFLERVHRQGAGNGILDMADILRKTDDPVLTTIRDGAHARVGTGSLFSLIGGAKILSYLNNNVQFLVRYRKTRDQVNAIARKALGFTEPGFQVGDRVMTLRNDYDLNVLNGMEFTVEAKVKTDDGYFAVRLKSVDDGTYRYLPMATPFVEPPPYDPDRPRAPKPRDVHELIPSYGITVHKAQGSQYPRCFVVNEPDSRSTPEVRRRWLYTAVTRAQEQVFVLGDRV